MVKQIRRATRCIVPFSFLTVLAPLAAADGAFDEKDARSYLNKVKANPALVNKPLIKGGKVVNSDHGAPATAVLLAAYLGDHDTLKWLFQKGAQVQPAHQRAVLFEAAGAWARPKDALACFQELWVTKKLTLADAARPKLLQQSIFRGQYLVATFLIENAVSTGKDALLHFDWARGLSPVYEGKPFTLPWNEKPTEEALNEVTAFAKLLILKGADVNARNKTDSGALYTVFPYPQLVDLLLESKCDPNAVSDESREFCGNEYDSGVTVLMLAAQGGHVGSVKALLKHGADKEAASTSDKKAIDGAKFALGKSKPNETEKRAALEEIIQLLSN